MGAKTKAVGGTPQTAAAKNYTSFLQQGLTGGFAGSSGSLGDSINSLLNGRPGDPTSVQNYQQAQGMYDLGSYHPGNVTSPNIDTSNLLTGFGGGSTPGNIDFSSLFNGNFGANPGNIDFSNFGPSNNTSATYNGPTDFSYNPTARTPTDVNSPYAQAVQQVLKNQQTQNVADLRARFTAGGGGAFGTPAAYAESNYRAQSDPQIAAALGQINQQEQGLDLQNKQLNDQGAFNNLNLGTNTALSQYGLNLNAGVTQRGQDYSNSANLLNSLLTNRGQDINNQLTSQQMGLTQNTALGSFLNDQRNTNINNANTNRGFDINQLGMLLQGNTANANNSMTAQQQNVQNVLQQLGLSQNYNLGVGNQNLQAAQLYQQNQQQNHQQQLALIQSLLGNYGNLNALGTTQAQIIQKPSDFQNAVGAATGIATAAAPFFL